MELFQILSESLRPVNQRPARFIMLRMDGDQIVANLRDDVKVGYSRHFKIVSVWKGKDILRHDEVSEDYTLNEFMDHVEHYQKLFL